MDSHTGFIIIHLIGMAFGVGGVTISHFYLHHVMEEPDTAQVYARMLPHFSLLIWFGVYLLLGDVVYELHGSLFELSNHELNVIHYSGMGLVKLFVTVFFFFPWLAIKLVLKKKPGYAHP